MEDKRISEKESLELIARMIRETQDNTARYAAYPLLSMGIYYCGYITCGMVLLFADGSVADQFSLVCFACHCRTADYLF